MAAFGELLDAFEGFLHTNVDPDDPETAALVNLPSRDVELATPLGHHATDGAASARRVDGERSAAGPHLDVGGAGP